MIKISCMHMYIMTSDVGVHGYVTICNVHKCYDIRCGNACMYYDMWCKIIHIYYNIRYRSTYICYDIRYKT